jgi:hypothetical protein
MQSTSGSASQRSFAPSLALSLVLFAALAVCVLSSPAAAQDKRDGHYWRNIPETEKLDIILGLFDGMALSESLIHIVVRDNYSVCTDVIESIMAQTAKYMNDLSTAQIATGLDSFYVDQANRDIPIFWGVWVVARQSKGDKNVGAFIKELRRAHK